jgi:hypothetical protein
LLDEQEKEIIQSDEFRKWFNGSVCVDEDGVTPMLVFYGGTRGETSNYWFSDSNIVAKYFGATARGKFRKTRFHKGFLRMLNPLVVDWGYDAWSFHYDDSENIVDSETMAVSAREDGYDGVIMRNIYEGEDENYLCDDYVVFDKSQIFWID